ncbi:MAG: VOC family protein [Defluviitaleaceae bacterium]|nr:VOC family protein [Defluviitaleaceae bacterium]
MAKGYLNTSEVTQIGIIVKDIETTAKKYSEFLGLPIPPIVETGELSESQATFNGQPCPARAKLAFFKVGDNISLELIQPDDQPSTWREFLDTKGEGIHHIAFGIKDTKAHIEKLAGLGIPLAQKGEYEGGRYAYFDATKDLKIIFETLEND